MDAPKTFRLAVLAAVAGAIALAAGGCRRPAGEPASRLFEKAGRFSYVTPGGWARHRVAGIPYHIVAGEEENGSAPNLFITDEESPEDPDAYAAAFVARQKKACADFVVRAEGTVTTEQGRVARVIEATRSARGTPLALRLYFLRRDQQNIVVSCSWPDAKESALPGIFDEALRSFRFEE